MSRYVPKTYNNRRLLRLVTRAVVSAALAAVVMFILLFFLLERYIVHDPAGGSLHLEIPWLMDEPVVSDSELED